jgi:hypothetical protein
MIMRINTKSFQIRKIRPLAKITALSLIQLINKFDFNSPINNLKKSISLNWHYWLEILP